MLLSQPWPKGGEIVPALTNRRWDRRCLFYHWQKLLRLSQNWPIGQEIFPALTNRRWDCPRVDQKEVDCPSIDQKVLKLALHWPIGGETIPALSNRRWDCLSIDQKKLRMYSIDQKELRLSQHWPIGGEPVPALTNRNRLQRLSVQSLPQIRHGYVQTVLDNQKVLESTAPYLISSVINVYCCIEYLANIARTLGLEFFVTPLCDKCLLTATGIILIASSLLYWKLGW